MERTLRSRVAGQLAAAALVAVVFVAPACDDAPAPARPGPRVATLVPPLQDAVAGETLVLRRGTTVWRWRVDSTTDETVAVEFVETDDRPTGAATPAPPTLRRVWSRNGFGLMEGLVVREIQSDRIDVAGRAWDCWRLRCHARSGVLFYWISDEVPVHGVLRIAPDLDQNGLPDPSGWAEYVPAP